MTRLESFPRALVGALLLGTLLLVGCDESVLGPNLRGTIEGQVLSYESESPLDGVSVTTSPATGAYVTDANGSFVIPDIESGPYNVTVRKEGYKPNSVSVAVNDDESTPTTIFMELSEEATRADSLSAEIVNWSGRVSGDSSYVDVEYRVLNAGTSDIGAYEVYVRVETDTDPFFQEIKGGTLPKTQVDIGTFSKYIRQETAQQVLIEDVWFERATDAEE